MRKLITGAAIATLCVVGASAAAQGQEPPPLDPSATGTSNATGTCTASAAVDGGFTIDPYRSSGVYEIPLSGSASYAGSVATPEVERPISGSVVIKSPPFIPDITLTDQWVWNGTAVRSSDNGNVEWDLPGALPRNVILTVEGEHNDSDIRCAGSVEIQIEGGAFDSPITPVSLGGTALAAVGMAFAARPRGVA